MWIDLIKALIPGLIAAGISGWLFASSDTVQLAKERLKTLGGFLFRSLAILGGVFVTGNAIYQFFKFGHSDDPIARLEVIELFLQALNILVYLPVTMFVIAYWLQKRKKQNSL
jgi:hypothetical protein